MAIKSNEELMNSLMEKLKDDNSDEAMALLEDVSDTLKDRDTRLSDKTDWKAKYEENDATWRAKYKERFSQPVEPPMGDDADHDENIHKPLTFEELFKDERR